MKTIGYYLFFTGIVINLHAVGQVCAEDKTTTESAPKSVPAKHPWFGKSSIEIRKQHRPLFQIHVGNQEPTYVFADHQGKSVKFIGRQVFYFDLEEFIWQHELMDIKSTHGNQDTGACYCYRHRQTGDSVRMIYCKNERPVNSRNSLKSELNELNLDWKANRYRSIG